ncbi:hypothetical protein ES707_09194 [subsurface metagenome]
MIQVKEHANWHMHYRLEKREGDINACKTPEERLAFLENTKPYEVKEGEHNCLLNTGINEIWALVTGVFNATIANRCFDNSNAKIGVGDSDTAADPAQEDLQADPNKLYKAMEANYPTSPPVSQKATFKASFGSAEANWTWNEWVVKSTSGTPTDICLNRKVESLGTKSTGTWTLEVDLTLT